MVFKVVGSEDVNLIKLAENGLQWRAVVKAVKYCTNKYGTTLLGAPQFASQE